VGTSGNASERVALVTARPRNLGPYEIERRRQRIERHLHLSAEQIGKLAAAIRDMNQIDTGHQLEHFAGDMVDAADAGRRHADLTRI
jgi:hypothetical protein